MTRKFVKRSKFFLVFAKTSIVRVLLGGFLKIILNFLKFPALSNKLLRTLKVTAWIAFGLNRMSEITGTQAHNGTLKKQNIMVCTGVYRQFDKVVKLYINSHLSVHTC